MRRVLVVGSWAKEHATIKNIRNNKRVKVFSYLDTKNPGIIPLVEGYQIASLYEVKSIVSYAKKIKADLVIITTAAPLSVGAVDALKEKSIFVFGPDRVAAQLESNKVFARQLMQKYKINALPEYKTFTNVESAIEFAKRLSWNVAVKPIGLTEGLGVRVFGDQSKKEKEVINYISSILEKGIGGQSKVLLEEKLEGEEFTLQCLVNGATIIPTPAVQDFKKLLIGDKGPNTASMGSYSNKGWLLPFMHQKDYYEALEIMQRTILAFEGETGHHCQGFLYGQFMLTSRGIKLVEYNFRPGDPEWINTLAVLKDNLLDVIDDLFCGRKRELSFENKASVCKYIVPKNYPQKLNEFLEISFDEFITKEKGVDAYYSCGWSKAGQLNVGSERGVAFAASADSIPEASEKIEKALLLVKGDFRYRKDIGTKDLIQSKIDYVGSMLQRKG